MPPGKVTVEVSPREAATDGDMMTLSGSIPSSCVSFSRRRWRRSDFSHHSRFFAEGLSGNGEGVEMEQARLAQVQHHLGHTAGEETWTVA